MAQYKIPYRGVDESLIHLRKQIFDSVPYCCENIPRFKNPKQLFYYLKKRITYTPDPHNVELFQTVQTLFNNNYHGVSGAGDCDDFTILAISCLICEGYYNTGIVLAGRKENRPTHIYAYVDTNEGRKYFDLTNPEYNQERYYPYKTETPFKITKSQIDMFLQLADNAPKRKRKKLNYDPYIFIPSKGVRVREDMYDKLTLNEFSEMMLSEGYSVEDVQGLAGRRAQRVQQRQERKAEKPRQVRKQERHELKMEKGRAKIDVKASKAETKRIKEEGKAQKRMSVGRSKETSAEAKRLKQERGDRGAGAMKIFDAAGQLITNLPSGQEGEETEIIEPQYQQTEFESVDFQTPETETEEIQSEEQGEELNEGLAAFYTKAFKKLFSKQDKPKRMKKLSPEQKQKIKDRFKSVQKYVQSGKLQAVTGAATRYSQGKPVVIQKEVKQPIKTDTYNIFGQDLPKPLVWGGGALIAYGIYKVAKR